MKISIHYLLLILLFSGMISCASPVGPTGGPADRTPPQVLGTDPNNETVQFSGREISFSFSRFINRSTFEQAISIEPDLLIDYDIRWRRRTATVQFQQPLPENMTIIIKLGTELADTRGNKIPAPYELAISTGPVIDDGTVTGRIRNASDGTGESGMRVFLYRTPFMPDERTNYVAQTDTAGRFQFTYLSEGEYQAIWVDDQNRNRIWEQNREWAQPFHQEYFQLEQEQLVNLGTLYVDRPDTTNPVLQGAGLLTSDYLRLRFNEEVFWEDGTFFTVLDTMGREITQGMPVYVPAEDPFVVFAQSLEALNEDQLHTINPEPFTDEAGNHATSNLDPFTGSAEPDTVSLRVIGDNRLPGLFANEPLIVGYSRSIDDDAVMDSLIVVEGEQIHKEWPSVRLDRHRLQIFSEGEQWESGVRYSFRIWDPLLERHETIEPRIWQRNHLGSIHLTLEDTTNRSDHRLTLFDEEGKVRVDTTFSQSIQIPDLPPLSFTVIVYRDRDGDGNWNPGSVLPFELPEPYFVRRSLPVREGFSSELTVSFEDQFHGAELPEDPDSQNSEVDTQEAENSGEESPLIRN